jgi:hypothetical protein
MRSHLPSLLRGARFIVLPALFLVAPAFAQWPVPGDDRDLLPFPAPAPLTLDRVQALYGVPSQRIGADLWVYWDYRFAGGSARRAGYDTLIVHFDGEFARTVKLVRGADVRALLAQIGQAKRVAVARPRP